MTLHLMYDHIILFIVHSIYIHQYERILMTVQNIKYKSQFLKEQRKHSKEKYGPDCTVSNTKFSSVTLNELTRKPEKGYCNFEFKQDSQ